MLTSEQERTIELINAMSREAMACLQRYAPAGHPYFDTSLPYFEVFEARFKQLGGFSPALSKAIDLEKEQEAP